MENISANELCRLLKEKPNNVVFLDVRSPEEYEAEHIPGTINIPVMGLLNRADELKGYEKIFINCKSGGRSSMACQYLAQQGFKNVYNVDGGIDAWKKCQA